MEDEKSNHHEHTQKSDVVFTDVNDEKEHNKDTHILIKSKSDANFAKANIKEVEQPKDIEMEDVSGLKSRTIDLTVKNTHNDMKTRRSKRSINKLLKRKIILEYTRSTHEFNVTVISNTVKPNKSKIKLNKTQNVKLETINVAPKKVEETPIEKKQKEDPIKKKAKTKKSPASKHTQKKHVSPKAKSSVKSLKVKPKQAISQNKEIKVKDFKEQKESKESKESKDQKDQKELKESKYALKLRSKQSEERKDKIEANHSTKRVLLKTIVVKDQKSEKKAPLKEAKTGKISPRTRSQKKQVKMKFDRSNSKRKVISKLVESIK